MSKKKATYNKTGIGNIPNNKPVLYRIKTKTGKVNYAGTAKRGRVQERLREHLGDIPGETVEIEQFDSINDARDKEARVIKINQPKYNDKGK